MSIAETLGQLNIGAPKGEFFGTVPDAAGPPDSLPAVVPDFVGELVSTLGGAVGDARDGLGDVVTGGLEAVGMATLGETLILLGNLVS